MDFSFSNEQQAWLKKAQALAPLLKKNAAAYDETAAFPEDNFKVLIDQKFHLLQVPKEYGGLNPEPRGNLGLTQFLVAEELARACPTTSWDLLIHFHQAGLLSRMGSDAQKRRFFKQIVEDGALMGSLGSEVNPKQFTAKNVQTRLTFDTLFEPVDGGFRANGEKHFCSMGPAAKILSFWAVAPGANGNADGLVISMIPSDSPGLRWEDSWSESIGLRGTVSWSAKLEDVFIPWENVLGQPGDFIQKDPYTYECSHSAHLIGTAQGILDDVLEFIKARDYLVTDEVLMYRLSELLSELQAARMSHYHAVWLWDQERFDEAGLASLAALHTAKKMAFRVANDAFDICGTRALFRFHRFERMWREVRASMLHTRDTQLMKYVWRGALDGGKQFSKLKYGEKLDRTRTWQDLGFNPGEHVVAAE